MKQHVCLLTTSPNKSWLDFLNTFTHYTLTVIIDDNGNTYEELQTQYPNIKFIQIPDIFCSAKGFINCAVPPTNPIPNVWDKALYYYSYMNSDYTTVWFLNEHVFFYDENTLLNIDSTYGKTADLLSQQYMDEASWMHWPNIKMVLPKPHYCSLVYACRVSKNLIDTIKLYANKYKTLFFVEALIPTLCHAYNMSQHIVSELGTINWHEPPAPVEHIYDLYHPYTSIQTHAIMRARLRIKNIKCASSDCIYSIHSDCTNNGGASCCMGCRLNSNHGPACQKNIHMLYTFIHPTKTGGTACENFFHANYSQYITGRFHDNKCANYNNSIIILRDPIERFISTYKYWKCGSQDVKHLVRSLDFINKNKNITIKDFISFLKNKDVEKLHIGITWSVHFRPQNWWINNTKYENIIIIIYEKDISKKISSMLKLLKITNKDVLIPQENITKTDEEVALSEEDTNFIKTYYAEDFKLLDVVRTQPELFKHVI